MKILCENINNYNYFSYLVNTLGMIPNTSIAVLSDIKQLVPALNEVQPNLIILNAVSVTPEVKAFIKKNKAKLIAFGDNIIDCDFFITHNRSLVANNILHDKVLANFNILQNTQIDNRIKGNLAILTGPNTNESLVNIIAHNYNVKIYGNKRINSPRFLGKINPEQRNSILKSTKYIIDFGTYDYCDSVLLGGYPILYSGDETPPYICRFWDMVSLIQVLDYLLDPNNTNEIEAKRQEFYHQVINNTSIDLTIQILESIGMKSNANVLKDIKKEMLS